MRLSSEGVDYAVSWTATASQRTDGQFIMHYNTTLSSNLLGRFRKSKRALRGRAQSNLTATQTTASKYFRSSDQVVLDQEQHAHRSTLYLLVHDNIMSFLYIVPLHAP